MLSRTADHLYWMARYIQRAELELMLELAGFKSWEIYGSYDLDPFTDHSDRLLVAAEKS